MYRRRAGALAVVTAVLTATLVGGVTTAGAVEACEGAATQGCWSAPFAEDPRFAEQPPQTPEESLQTPTAVSAVVTPSGRIIYWNGLSGLEDSNGPLAADAGRSATPDESRVLDLTDDGEPAFLTPVNSTGGGKENLFCSDQRLLASGKVLDAGGTKYESEIPTGLPDGPGGLAELYGSKETRVFDIAGASGGAWEADRPASTQMHYGRWYPSLITQADGDLFVAGGVSKLLWNSKALDEIDQDETDSATDYVPRNVPQTETYHADTDSWSDNGDGANKSLPLFARVHLLPSGEVLYTGAGQMWGPAGHDVDQNTWNNKATYNPATKTWRTLDDDGEYGARNGAFSAMLPIKAPFDQAQFILAGGTLGTSPGTYLGTKITEVVTAKDDDGDGAWETSTEQVADLNNDRWFSSGVVLPNGEVLAFNGADKDEVVMPSIEQPVRQAELWNGSEWVALSSGSRDRTYHNSALLLPDGSVLVGGHSPINKFYGDKGDGSWDDAGFANNLKDPSFERFYPPYLFKGPRPLVSGLTRETVHYGEKIEIALGSNNPVPISKVVLSRLPAVTHTTDADARTIDFGAPAVNGQNISVDVPNAPSALPPGYYYVFALSDQGVPSEAAILKIDYDDGAEAAAGPAKPIHLGGLATGDAAAGQQPVLAGSGSAPAGTPARSVALPTAERSSALAVASALLFVVGAALVTVARRRRWADART